MAEEAGWEPPSAAVAALIRATAERFLEDPQALFDAVDASVLQTAGGTLASEPALVAAMRQSNHANLLRWGRANVRSPGEPVPPLVSAETLDLSRDVVRRGLDDPMQAGYRVGQNVAWRRWMTVAFELSEDVATLQQALDVSARSIEAFVEGTVSGIREQIDREREGLQRGAVAQRLEVVSLISRVRRSGPSSRAGACPTSWRAATRPASSGATRAPPARASSSARPRS